MRRLKNKKMPLVGAYGAWFKNTQNSLSNVNSNITQGEIDAEKIKKFQKSIY